MGKKDGKSDGSIEHHFERFFKRGYDVTIYTKLSNGFITDLVIEKDGIQQVIEFKLRNKDDSIFNIFTGGVVGNGESHATFESTVEDKISLTIS